MTGPDCPNHFHFIDLSRVKIGEEGISKDGIRKLIQYIDQ